MENATCSWHDNHRRYRILCLWHKVVAWHNGLFANKTTKTIITAVKKWCNHHYKNTKIATTHEHHMKAYTLKCFFYSTFSTMLYWSDSETIEHLVRNNCTQVVAIRWKQISFGSVKRNRSTVTKRNIISFRDIHRYLLVYWDRLLISSFSVA